jgi:hypothetical protein
MRRVSISCCWLGQNWVWGFTYMTARPIRPRSALGTLSAFVVLWVASELEGEVEEVCCC